VPAAGPTPFQRVVFHGRPVGEPLLLPPEEKAEARRLEGGGWRLAEGEIGILVADASVARALSAPPPVGLSDAADRVGVVVLGEGLAKDADPFWSARVFFSLPEGAASHHLARAVKSLFRILEDRALSARAGRALAARTEETKALVEVGIALSAESDPDRLLETILTRARALTQAEGGSLYLIERGDAGDVLKFVQAQNDSVRFEFAERTLPLDDSSIAGFTARAGEPLNLPDVYRLAPDAPYRFDPGFDRRYGYTSRSMLAVPMKTPQGHTIGVLQLLNRIGRILPSGESTAAMRAQVVPFDDENVELARSFAAQAAVAVENRRLTENIRRLFEGFVQASVTAIEQRDPTTSGHSERVAKLSCGLAEAADRCDGGPYAHFRISKEQLRELRYAAVLHDFGKIGVREQVLVKARKLPPLGLELLRSRFDQAVLSSAAEIWERAAREKLTEREVARQMAQRQGALERAWRAIQKANEPSLLAAEISAEIDRLGDLTYRDASGAEAPLVTPEEVAFLSIPKGSLTGQERREIESHVTQSFRFLTTIPWTPDLSRVPDIAYAHHEKLDGSGYPRKLTASDIPVPVRALTISDIYDALAARDRPYKKAVPNDRALDILRAEATRGLIDTPLLDLFIEAKVFETALAKSAAPT
jgi:HD-GYP domain-containing protein (c-di-GMP phosphodiesterase class II)